MDATNAVEETWFKGKEGLTRNPERSLLATMDQIRHEIRTTKIGFNIAL